MGHLTRLMAYARRAEPDLAPHFLSLSQAVGVVAQYGFPFEYVPSAGATGLPPRRWNKLFTERVSEAMGRLRPAVVVFDGTWPYNGIRGCAMHFRRRVGCGRDGDVASRQVRRADGQGGLVRRRSWLLGELAAAYDRGATSRADGLRVGPVTLLDTDELDDRDTARRALGLPLDRRLALVALGAGNINDTSHETGATVAALRRLGVEICVTQTPIADADRARAMCMWSANSRSPPVPRV